MEEIGENKIRVTIDVMSTFASMIVESVKKAEAALFRTTSELTLQQGR